jgi:hypothetical protein
VRNWRGESESPVRRGENGTCRFCACNAFLSGTRLADHLQAQVSWWEATFSHELQESLIRIDAVLDAIAAAGRSVYMHAAHPI